MFKHILVVIDRTDEPAGNLSPAIEFARKNQARITFLLRLDASPTLHYSRGALSNPDDPARLRSAIDATMRQTIDTAERLAWAAGLAYSIRTTASRTPLPALIEASSQNACDLIFLTGRQWRELSAEMETPASIPPLTLGPIPVIVHH